MERFNCISHSRSFNTSIHCNTSQCISIQQNTISLQLYTHPYPPPPKLPSLPFLTHVPSITSSRVSLTPFTTHWYSPMSSSCTFRTSRLPFTVTTYLSDDRSRVELNSHVTGMPGGRLSLHSSSMFWRSRARIDVKFSAVSFNTVTLHAQVL